MTDYTADWTALPTRESADSRLHQDSARHPFPFSHRANSPLVRSSGSYRSIDICVLANSAPPRARAITQSHITQYEQPRAQSVSGRPRQHPHETWPHVTTVVGVIVDSPCPRQACADAIACCERRPEACIEARRCGTCVEAQSLLECGSEVQHGEESRSI